MKKRDEQVRNQLAELQRRTGWEWMITPHPAQNERFVISCGRQGACPSWPHTMDECWAHLAGLLAGISVGQTLLQPRIDHLVRIAETAGSGKKSEKLH